MIELSRHIEILLLSNDCVIVPGLGGFVAHQVCARYDETDGLFLPPYRTLGFNPQLKMNDSLLAQSYVEAYDTSLPEALLRIEDEVNELIQIIHDKGSYDLSGVGTLSLNNEGNYVFTPCEAGTLSPSLYALSSFEFPVLQHRSSVTAAKSVSIAEDKVSVVEEKHPVIGTPVNDIADDEDDAVSDALIIRLSWIRNAVAVAAAVLMFVLMTTPISNSESPDMAYTNFNSSVIFDTTKKIVSFHKTQIPEKKPVITINKDSIRPVISKTDSISRLIEETIKDDSIARKPVVTYCLVLASYVSKKNANAFVDRLHKAGFEDAEVYIRNNVTRVIYGNFSTLNEAYGRLNQIRGNKDFEEAWVLKTTDRG